MGGLIISQMYDLSILPWIDYTDAAQDRDDMRVLFAHGYRFDYKKKWAGRSASGIVSLADKSLS